jgi:hypothetical protein
MRIALALLLAGSLVLGAQKKPNRDTRALIEVVELRAERLEGKIAIDGIVKNAGIRPIPGPILLINLLESGKKVIAQRRGSLEQEVLEPGEEVDFHFYVAEHARAVWVSVGAESARLVDVGVAKSGPFPIE